VQQSKGESGLQVGLGRQGVISIERESRLSGRIHDKGVMILSGYLRGALGQNQPMAMAVSITFEQSYGGVEGDSASSTEIYAILSALAGVPVRQGFAVTGSMDQWGRIQAIGGVNEKIEGVFDLCRDRGLTGSQGVLIPRANVEDLQLRPDVVKAVEAGTFRVMVVDTVAEGIEILTGIPIGERDEEGNYQSGSILGRCSARLREMADRMRSFREPE
jgi:Lon-like ATP-dependent protease